MTLAINRITPEIRVGGTALPDSLIASLVKLRVSRGLCVVGRAVLHFSDNGYQLSAGSHFPLGQTVNVALHSGEALFSGVVTGVALEQVSGTHPELVVTADDPACKLALGTNVVTHENTTYSSVVSDLVGPCGLTVAAELGSMGSESNEYLLQTSTDLAYVDEITRRANSVWWVDDGKFNVKQAGTSSGTAKTTLGENLLEFSVRASGLRPTTVAVNGWDPSAQTDITGDGGTPNKTADSTFVSEYLGTGPSTLTSATLTAGHGNPNVAAEATALAESLNSEWHAGAVVARGLSIVDPTILPMVALTVAQAGPASGTYTVSEVEHVLRADGFYTRFTAGPVRPAGLVDTLGHDTPDAGFSMPGLTTGVVSDTDDPNQSGRVKIKYTGAGGQLVSNWARVVSLGGGDSRGSVFLPEVKDEVLIGFERGDSRHPVVIGGLFSQNIALAADSSLRNSSGAMNYRRITSRLGHYMELGDGSSDSESHILMQLAQSAAKMRLGADKFELNMSQNQPITITNGIGKIEIDDQGNINIEGLSITIKANKNIDIEAQMDATLKGTTGVTVQGLQAAVKADATLDLEGQAQTTIKGGMVMIN